MVLYSSQKILQMHSTRKNEKFLELIDMDKDEFDDSDIDAVERVLDVKYKLKNNSVSN